MHSYRLTGGAATYEVIFVGWSNQGLTAKSSSYVILDGLTMVNARKLCNYLNGGEGISNAVATL